VRGFLLHALAVVVLSWALPVAAQTCVFNGGQPNVASLFYGPVLLAAEEPEARTDWRKVELDVKDISRSITGDPATLRFQVDGVAFRPFFETYGRHSVYVYVAFK